MTDTSPQQVLERLLASADARGADVVRACLHPDVDFSAPGVSGDADSLLAWMSPLMAAASHLHHQVVSAVSAGDNAAAELATTVSFDPTDGPGSNLLRACNVWRCCAPDPTRPATTWPGRPAARPTPTSGPANGTACGPGRARPRPGMTGELDAAGGRVLRGLLAGHAPDGRVAGGAGAAAGVSIDTLLPDPRARAAFAVLAAGRSQADDRPGPDGADRYAAALQHASRRVDFRRPGIAVYRVGAEERQRAARAAPGRRRARVSPPRRHPVRLRRPLTGRLFRPFPPAPFRGTGRVGAGELGCGKQRRPRGSGSW